MTLRRIPVLIVFWLLTTSVLAATAEVRRLEVDGIGLHYDAMGEGTPVVLVHGYTSAGDSWLNNGIAATLAEHHRVLVLDARGHGRSDKPHNVDAYGTKMAADVVALLDHEGIERAHLVGYSMGGLLVLKAVTLAPDRFASVVIGGQGWAGDSVGLDPNLTEQIAEALENGRGIEPLLVALNPEGAPPMTREQIDAANEFIIQQNDPLALAAVIRSAGGWTADLAAMQANPVPAIAVIGDRDPLITSARNLAGNLANFRRLEVLVGATHGAVVRDPDYAARFGNIIVEFVGSIEQ